MVSLTDSKTIGIHRYPFLDLYNHCWYLYPVRNNAPLEFLTGFTLNLSSRFFLLGMGEDIFWFLDDLFLS